jgi:hypothetical protein
MVQASRGGLKSLWKHRCREDRLSAVMPSGRSCASARPARSGKTERGNRLIIFTSQYTHLEFAACCSLGLALDLATPSTSRLLQSFGWLWTLQLRCVWGWRWFCAEKSRALPTSLSIEIARGRYMSRLHLTAPRYMSRLRYMSRGAECHGALARHSAGDTRAMRQALYPALPRKIE